MAKTLLLKNAAELVTCRGHAPKCGPVMQDIGIIEDGALWLEDGIINNVGTTAEILAGISATPDTVIDATGRCVLPGFVDPHTHFLFAGHRAEEFSWRLRGDTYMDIMERGGGIINSVRATRQASADELLAIGLRRLDSMLSFGVTTVEGKSGYGQIGRAHV